MFTVHYHDGRTAYLTVSPATVEKGADVVREQISKRQEKGEIPQGAIATFKRVR
jgi:hypothetical protein